MNKEIDGVKDVIWTQEMVDKFWDLYSKLAERDLVRMGTPADYFMPRNDRLHVEIMERVKQGASILDIGCGIGYSMAYLGKYGYKVHGIDGPENHRIRAKKACEEASVLCEIKKGGWTEIPYPDNFFDCVYSVDVIEHIIPDVLDKGMLEIKKVLKPGGYHILMTDNGEEMFHSMALCPECHAWFHMHQHQQSFNKEKLTSIFQRAGFSEITVLPCYQVDLKKRWYVKPYLRLVEKIMERLYIFGGPNKIISIGRKSG